MQCTVYTLVSAVKLLQCTKMKFSDQEVAQN